MKLGDMVELVRGAQERADLGPVERARVRLEVGSTRKDRGRKSPKQTSIKSLKNNDMNILFGNFQTVSKHVKIH